MTGEWQKKAVSNLGQTVGGELCTYNKTVVGNIPAVHKTQNKIAITSNEWEDVPKTVGMEKKDSKNVLFVQ